MIGFFELKESAVIELDVGTEVFVRLTGRGWEANEREEDEGLYHVGYGHKIWNEDGEKFFFTYEMNLPNYEYKVYIPDMRYKLNHIIQDIKVLLNIYKVPLEDVFDRIRKGVRNVG